MRSITGFALSTILCANLFAVSMPLASMAQATAVRVAGSSAFTISTGGGGMSAAARAATVQKNLDNALAATDNRGPESVQVVYVKGLPVITIGGFTVVTVDEASAKAAGTTPTLLSKRWTDSLRNLLRDRQSVDSYVAHLTGAAPVGTTQLPTGDYHYYRQGRVVYIPAGMVLPVTLSTSISSQIARPGDRVEAKISQNVNLGDTSIPAGSIVTGQVTDAQAGRRMGRTGTLGLKFNTLRTPDGRDTPINASIVGGIGGYSEAGGEGTARGETGGTKVKKAALHTAVGAGGGALAGVAIGAIAARSGRGVGRGAWSGTAIGGGLGLANSMLIRRGTDVKIPSGTPLQLQLDSPTQLNVTTGAM